MPNVKIYQGDSVQLGPANTTPLQAGNFGESGIGAGLEIAGKAVSQYAEAHDQVQEIYDRQNAQELSLQHLNLAKTLDTTVRQAQGMNAMPAAEAASDQLHKTATDLLGQARSDRARLMLRQEILPRNAEIGSSWENHGIEQQRVATVATTKALTESTIHAATMIPEEGAAQAMFAKTNDLVDQQARFLGLPAPVADAMKRDNATAFYKTRAEAMVTDPKGASFGAAIAYMGQHRAEITDEGYNQFVSAYHERAMDEAAKPITDNILAHMGDPRAGRYTPGQVANGVGGGPAPVGMVKPDGTLDQHAFFIKAVDRWEGGYTIDVNGYPVNHGINGQFHPGVDIKHVTSGQAADIMVREYGQPYAHLPAAMAAVATDTAFINKDKAKEFLAEADGDPQRFMDLREAWMARLEKADPKKYGPVTRGWANRNAQLRNLAAQMTPSPPANETAQATPTQQAGQAPTATDVTPATAQAPVQQDARAPSQPVTARPFSYDDAIAQVNTGPYSPEMKQHIIAQLKERRGEEVRATNQNYQDAEDAAMKQVVALGDKFTSVSQIDPNLWQRMNGNTQERLTSMAKSNVSGENKPLTPEVATLINYTRYANPQHFTSPQFQAELLAKGAPPSTIREVASEAGTMLGQQAGLQPKFMKEEQIWQIAKPMFEQAGLHFDTVEAKGDKKAGERQADAASKAQALSYLRDIETRWANANPGKMPDEALVRGWAAHALIGTANYRRFSQPKAELVRDLAPALRARIANSLRAHGQPVNDDTIYDAYKTVLSLNGGAR